MAPKVYFTDFATRNYETLPKKLARLILGRRSFRVARSAWRQARVQRRRRCERCRTVASQLRTGGIAMSAAVAARMIRLACRRSPTSPLNHQ